MKGKKVKLYYALRKTNPDHDPRFTLDKFLYLKKDQKEFSWNIGRAKLFNTKEEAETYKANHKELNDCKVFEIDPRKHCLSEYSCDDCSWGGTCPRHPND